MPSDPRDQRPMHEFTLTHPEHVAGIERAEVGATPPDDRYEQGELIGKGGMGEVWEWRDKRISRPVACKLLRRERTGNPGMQGRFLREARVQGQLEHPSVVPIYDLGTTGTGDLYFT